MNTTTTTVGTGLVIAAGKWANGEHLDITIAIGVGALAVSMAIISNANERLANILGAAIFFGALLKYLPVIVTKLGWQGAASGGTN
jgi:hypothetical protein